MEDKDSQTMVTEEEAFREIISIFKSKGMKKIAEWEQDSSAAKVLDRVVEKYMKENHYQMDLQRALDIWKEESKGRTFSSNEKYVNNFCKEIRHIHKVPDLNFIEILDLDFEDSDDRRHALSAWFHVFPHHRVTMPQFPSPAKLFFDYHFCKIQFTDIELDRLMRSGFDFRK